MFLKKLTNLSDIKANIFRVQANNPIMCEYFCIVFINFVLAAKKVTDCMSMFSPYNFERNHSKVYSYFKDE